MTSSAEGERVAGGKITAFIKYLPADAVSAEDRVPDDDNILRIHSVHGRTIKLHYDLYRELMYGAGPLNRIQREMIAVTVSAKNGCKY